MEEQTNKQSNANLNGDDHQTEQQKKTTIKLDNIIKVLSTVLHQKTINDVSISTLQTAISDLNHYQAQQVKLIKLLKNKKLLIVANYDNLQKKLIKEQARIRKYRGYEIFIKMLPVLDNMENALQVKNVTPDVKNFLIGFKMIYKEILKIMQDENVKIIQTKIGDQFNHNLHHAMDTKYNSTLPINTILQVLQKGYLLHDLVLRHASVVVAKPQSQTSDKNTTDTKQSDQTSKTN